MSESLNQADSRPSRETLDRYANFFVVHSTIAGSCIVPYCLKYTELKLNSKLRHHKQMSHGSSKIHGLLGEIEFIKT